MDRESNLDPRPVYHDHIQQGLSQTWPSYLSSKGLELHTGQLSPGDLQQEAQLIKHLDLKTNGIYVKKSQRAIGNQGYT